VPQYDAHHEVVKRALVNDGWTITDDPLELQYKDMRLFADLGAERALAAQKGDQKIAVEIKVFGGISPTTELQKAKGQYDFYRLFLERTEPERKLYLAVPSDIWGTFFQRPSVQEFVAAYQLSLLIFDPERAEVVQWIR
jgi:hypothetical protein